MTINVAGYAVGRGLAAFGLPLAGTAAGLATFLVILSTATDPAGTLTAFLVGQMVWAAVVVVGAWAVYRRFRHRCEQTLVVVPGMPPYRSSSPAEAATPVA